MCQYDVVRCPCVSVWCCKVSLCVSMMWGSCMCQLMWHINIFPSTDCRVNFVLGYGVICQPAQYCVILCCTVPDGSLSAMWFFCQFGSRWLRLSSCKTQCHLVSLWYQFAVIVTYKTMSFGVIVVSVGCKCHLQDTMSFGVTVVSVGCDCRLQDTMSFGVTVVSVCCNCHLQDTMSFHAIVVPGGSMLLSARDTMSFLSLWCQIFRPVA